ncbi:PucR family transcriptional regulator ligand-binding domain-containing protein [Streptomyces tubbatahanensis]|uniref:PucR family transcriptional regulator ligand-binding domain-containing protein n=1 Tax=Streptomyces tubbatahanensis TaxID=2923272 RepID=A0ABY3XLD6_9ACTN|nr:PucR family transcriptional regulator [Streptomyces tubbatahanensis]UNS95209.1 PucR family transcriptional regulator ligand-binding domain-containing protein [Streptomyces tubbatahanensis]
MSVTVSDLLDESALGLRALTRHCRTGDRSISWVSTTELPDPLPFLRGGELVLSTGMLERKDAEWHRLAHRLAELPVAALCFGTGLVHRSVPHAVVEAAEEAGLALVSSPVEVPFVQISHWVAERIFAERYDAVRAAVTLQDELVRELTSGHGFRGLLRRLHRQLGAGALAVVDPAGLVLSRFPASSAWPDATQGRLVDEAGTAVPVSVADVPVAWLCTRRPAEQRELLSFATSILGLEVARHQAVLTGRRELLGQLLEDVVHRTVSEGEARRRLSSYGISTEAHHAVVVARIVGDPDRLRTLPWTLRPLLEREGDRLPTALIDDTVTVLVPEGADAEASAHMVARHLAMVDRHVHVGVSEARRGVPGLRTGYFEARQGAQAGPGVHRASPLSITGLLMGNLELPLHDLGRAVLAPLLRYDEEHHAELTATLRTYLAHDCAPAATAEALTLHRNSLRYRLRLVEQLTGRDLGRLANRMELWLALSALEAGGEGGAGAVSGP